MNELIGTEEKRKEEERIGKGGRDGRKVRDGMGRGSGEERKKKRIEL